MWVEKVDKYSTMLGSEVNTDTNLSEVSKQDFMMLLMAQLQNQDPMEPTTNEQFMTQLAQFNSMESMLSMQGSMESLVRSNNLSRGAALVGRYVTGIDSSSGEIVEGFVTSASMLDDTVNLNLEAYNSSGQLIGEYEVPIDTISQISL